MSAYTGTATLSDGRQITVSGTSQECANWADNIVRQHKNVYINIRRVEDECKAESEDRSSEA